VTKSFKSSADETAEYNAALRRKAVFRLVKEEIAAARVKHQPFNSWHEAHSVIQEEFEEFWDSVKEDETDIAELVSVAAMAILAIMELEGQTDQYGKRIKTEWRNT